MSKLRGDKVAQELCVAMGIDPQNIHSLQFVFEAGGVAHVIIERYLGGGEDEILRKILSEYDIVGKNKT